MSCAVGAGDISQNNHTDYTGDVTTIAASTLNVTKVTCTYAAGICSQTAPGSIAQSWDITENNGTGPYNISAFVNNNGGISQAECVNNQIGSVNQSSTQTVNVSLGMNNGNAAFLVVWASSPYAVLSVVSWYATVCA